MTKKELCALRIITLGDGPLHYPGSKHRTGFILTGPSIPEDWKLYPHLYRELLWHENRKPRSMPEYVSYLSLTSKKRVVHKTGKWVFGRQPYEEHGKLKWLYTIPERGLANIYFDIYDSSLPATESEYLIYLKRKQNEKNKN
jgi:hypothetical protein